ncbi:hypothetical protein [Kitasatospora viridis]|uniref:NHL repeat-containing protein n=1 Tax=Kitasatospora viridis TaxID=281105 RepID=A0A561TSJ1_9ACTN|nr:hypothetical protein [Kitasatospora viridis]TWF90071.1 NHL repeat-containing protein [Kitasatospora viridis]
MRIDCGPIAYEWVDAWAAVPDPALAGTGWAHPGIQVTDAGEVVTFHPREPLVLVLGTDGSLLRSFPVRLGEGHGLRIDGDAVWIADPGGKSVLRPDGTLGDDGWGPAVAKYSLDGRELGRVERPPAEVYADGGHYAPTDVAVDAATGDLWVTDGYGSSLVHKFDGDGRYLLSINGQEGGSPFDCPHSIALDTRRGAPELYVADRGNARIQVYGTDGTFRRTVGQGVLNSPSVFAFDGDHLIVGELYSRLAVLDGDDELVGYLGDNGAVTQEPGWPNALDTEGRPVPTDRLQPGKFNSPHGLASDPDGNLYIAEWLLGGRYTKLAKQTGS